MTQDTPRPSVAEIMRSLTGFDELAIETLFRKSIAEMSGSMAARAMAFIVFKREDAEVKDKDAFKRAMELPLGDLNDLFTESDDDSGND